MYVTNASILLTTNVTTVETVASSRELVTTN